MATCRCASRTNYFRVTDEEEYRKLYEGLRCEDRIDDMTKTDGNGVVWHGFCSEGFIGWLGEERDDWNDRDEEEDYADEDPDISGFIERLRKILPEDEAFILLTIDREGLRYVCGSAHVATRDESKYIDLTETALNTARRMLGDKDWTTRCSY